MMAHATVLDVAEYEADEEREADRRAHEQEHREPELPGSTQEEASERSSSSSPHHAPVRPVAEQGPQEKKRRLWRTWSCLRFSHSW